MVASKYLKNKEIDDKTIQKLIRFLSYRGYDFDKINAVVSRLKKGDEWEC
jgi:SOS response regulatory protein OraA/RecX